MICAPVRLEARRNFGNFAGSSWGPLTATVANWSKTVALSQDERSFPHTPGRLAPRIGGVSATPDSGPVAPRQLPKDGLRVNGYVLRTTCIVVAVECIAAERPAKRSSAGSAWNF